MRNFLCVLLLLHSGLSFGGEAPAIHCKCESKKTIDGAFEENNFVFLATVVDKEVLSMLPPGQQSRVAPGIADYAAKIGLFEMYKVTLSVSRWWKGQLTSEVQVYTKKKEVLQSSCGYPFEKGQEYLVYANKPEEYLFVHSCSRTMKLNLAEEDLSSLSNYESNAPLDDAVVDDLENQCLAASSEREDYPLGWVVLSGRLKNIKQSMLAYFNL